ncbi:MAG: LuxR C-terminal-related transcriptional regulator [Burkholderiales bacterium]|nr:LuxR C-terminal-related transcriptional regulator [Burkholderiales bacterium]
MAKPHPAAPPVTKLTPPSSEALVLARPRVLAKLGELATRKLAVVTAPTGSGKSTLLAQATVELASRGFETCWLSLDAADNEPRRFFANLVAAIRQARPGAGAATLELLRSAADVPTQDLAAALINDLMAGDAPLAVFLDDFQEIVRAEVHAALAYLLQYSPAGVRFAIASQTRLPVSVARLRARNALVALDFADLRFSLDEIRAYVAAAGARPLSEGDLRALEEQTEGWICGLQLATIAMGERSAEDVLAGPSRAEGFADYLLEDILARQPADLQRFLLDTAILDRFCAPLCDALCGPGSAERIAALERANLFVVRTDAERVWFRYHHLFSAFLRARVRAAAEPRTAGLHARAARWFAGRGNHAEAIRYAVAGGVTGLACELLERWGRLLLREGDFKALHYWLAELPRAAVRSSPELSTLDAWAELYRGDPLAARAAIDAAEAALGERGRAGDGAAQRLAGELQIARTMSGVTRYDLPDVAGLRADLPALFGAEDALQRAYAHVVLGYAARLAGALEDARRNYAEGRRIAEASGQTVVALMARYNLAMVDYLSARPDAAAAELGRWLGDARNRPWLRTGSAAFLRAALGLVSLDRDEAAAALAALDEAVEILDATQTYAYVGIAQAIRAQARMRLGDADGAAADLKRAESIGAQRDLGRVLIRAHVTGARVACRRGDLDAAAAHLAAARSALERSGHLAQTPQTEHVQAFGAASAELDIARGRVTEALRTLAPALRDARRAGRTRTAVELLVLQALAWLAGGNAAKAAERIGEALALAMPGELAYPFVGLGERLGAVLALVPQTHPQAAFADGLAARMGPAALPRAPAPVRSDALHQRELQILGLLGLGLRNREIGARLFISEETVKWYLKRIFEALGVANRTHALVRARELGLLR